MNIVVIVTGMNSTNIATLMCQSSNEKTVQVELPSWCVKMWIRYGPWTPFPSENFRTSSILRIDISVCEVLSCPPLVAMSSKNTSEKVLEIDAHVSKHYDIVRRLGKGVIFFVHFVIFTNCLFLKNLKLLQYIRYSVLFFLF